MNLPTHSTTNDGANSTTTTNNRKNSISKKRRSSPYSIQIPNYVLEQTILNTATDGTNSSTSSTATNSRRSSLFAEEEMIENNLPSPRITPRSRRSSVFHPTSRKSSTQVLIEALQPLSIESNNFSNTYGPNIGDASTLMDSTLGLLTSPQTPIMSSLSVASNAATNSKHTTNTSSFDSMSSYTNSVIHTPSTAPACYTHNRDFLLQELEQYRLGETNTSYERYELGDHIFDKKFYRKNYKTNGNFLRYFSRSSSASAASASQASESSTNSSHSQPSQNTTSSELSRQ